MPALDAVVTTFLTRVKSDLNTGSDISTPGAGNVRAAPKQYILAQDMAAVLDLLQDALDTAEMTATGGSPSTLVDGANTFITGTQQGNTVTFESDTTTAALRDTSAVILSNTSTTLTFTQPLAGTPVSGDTYRITGSMCDKHIEAIRGAGLGIGENPRGMQFAEAAITNDALTTFIRTVGSTPASSTLTFSGVGVNTQTVTTGTKVYTLQTVLTNVDGNVLIGANAAATVANLVAAINLGAGVGTTYATLTTANTFVTAADGAGDTVVVTAKTLLGTAGNAIAIAETCTNASWTGGALFLAGGAGGATTARNIGTPGLLTAAGSTTERVNLASAQGSYQIDQLRGMQIVVGTEDPRIIVSNDEDSVLVNKVYGSAPSASTAVTITVPTNQAFISVPTAGHLAGSGPGENLQLAETIRVAQAAAAAFVTPV